MPEITNKRNWKLIYSNYDGPEKRAVDFISREMGAHILRDKGVYTIHVLACEHISRATLDKSAVVLGTYKENAIIQKHIKESEIPENGYVVKVMDNPELPDCKLVLITAKNPREVFYGAADFIDDYLSLAMPYEWQLEFPEEIFDRPMPDYYNASAPQIKTRSIFTWGHPINNYREYIENMARLKLNQLIIWNDFIPVNAKEVMDYAHSFGISVIWGYAWGWGVDCTAVDLDKLDELTEQVIAKYEDEYKDCGADGIYFQSFTELRDAYIGDKLIADVVVDFVNKTADRLLSKYPDLYIQFGLHASSVKDHMDFIAKTDPRVEIMWEDCGTFPYNNEPIVHSEKDFQDAIAFTDQMLNLREKGGVSMLYKGLMRLDWTRFVYQCGPFVMGDSSPKIVENDLAQVTPMWRHFQRNWHKYGHYAYEMTRHIVANAKDDITIGMAAQLAGGIWFGEALCAQMLWECDKPYQEIVDKVSRRQSTKMV
ncbi:MAG: hypothetical protein IJB80_03855 [Clostridia bacterium]|nr:hypothetical protein [Clostridia bacterium]